MIFLANFPAGMRAHCLEHLTRLHRPGWSNGTPETWEHYTERPKSERGPGRPPGAPGEVQVKAWLLRKPPADRGAWHVPEPRTNALVTELLWCLDVLGRSGFGVRYAPETMGKAWPLKYRGRTLHRIKVGEGGSWAAERPAFLRACRRD